MALGQGIGFDTENRRGPMAKAAPLPAASPPAASPAPPAPIKVRRSQRRFVARRVIAPQPERQYRAFNAGIAIDRQRTSGWRSDHAASRPRSPPAAVVVGFSGWFDQQRRDLGLERQVAGDEDHRAIRRPAGERQRSRWQRRQQFRHGSRRRSVVEARYANGGGSRSQPSVSAPGRVRTAQHGR